MKLDLEKKHFELIASILRRYPYSFFVFGSRVKGKARPLSDLDLCYTELIRDAVIVQLEGEFEDSDLPFKVDIVDFQACQPNFQKIISEQWIEWNSLVKN